MIARAGREIKIINEDAPDLEISNSSQLELIKSSSEPVIEIDIKSLNFLKSEQAQEQEQIKNNNGKADLDLNLNKDQDKEIEESKQTQVQENININNNYNYNNSQRYSQRDENSNNNTQREFIAHPKPKYTYAYLAEQSSSELKDLANEFEVENYLNLRKDDLIFAILKAQAESMNYRFGGGTLEILPEGGFGFLRPRGMLPTDSDVYLSASQIRRFGLRNGDVVWGLIRPPREPQEHYEALLRVETVNYSDPEESRRRPLFSNLTPIFPNKRIDLSS
ncbi:MAG: Rho termination factor N-terminal domain-containing protein, partial [Synergistaceae bacterium]|nr:Rho termination factor N-terminal domain-containing protein [Synergistaceae bacterium]